MPKDELEPLRKATTGLTYPSESDEPFDVFRWDAHGAARDQVVAHGGKGRAIEEVPLATFFAQLEDSDDAPRFHALRKAIESRLKDVAVFRAGAGEVRVDVYIVGKAPSGLWAGLHTVSVET